MAHIKDNLEGKKKKLMLGLWTLSMGFVEIS